MKHLPFAMILFRLLLAPLVIYIAYLHPGNKSWIAVICVAALASDILDGILARHLGVASAKLRLWDSNVDVVFWMCACWCIWVIYPELVTNHMLLIIPLLVLEWIPDIIYYCRFKKFGCAHNYLSKLFGLFLLAVFMALFVFDYSGWLFSATIVVGLLSQVDRIFIAALLPARVCDVPSAYHAYLTKKGIAYKKYKLFHSDQKTGLVE